MRFLSRSVLSPPGIRKESSCVYCRGFKLFTSPVALSTVRSKLQWVQECTLSEGIMSGLEWRTRRVAGCTFALQGLGAAGSDRCPARLDTKRRSMKGHFAVDTVSLLLAFVRSWVQIRAGKLAMVSESCRDFP